jgi:mRNA-degrading endonuclease YafQ of YafQ-DinJ toxin-antitoxin module
MYLVEELSRLIGIIDEGSKKVAPSVAPAPTTMVRIGSNYKDTLNSHPLLLDKVDAFIRTKLADYSAQFGASDKAFAANGNFINAVPGLKHAHLNHDISMVYKIHGANPRFLDLYGLFSHDDLGTGQPKNDKRQKTRAKQFSNDKFISL